MSQDKSDTAPPTASAGITPTQGDQGITSVIDTSLRAIAPSNNALEIAQHTGVINRLDDYFYSHFIRFTSFSWTTSQLTGHVLYSLPLTPYNLSSPLAYVMALYNQWAGGFQIRIEVAGTGFNGGKLMFVRFPPNVDPDNYDINSATVFPYIMLDPKSQVSGILDIEDYRQGLFHWNQRFSDPYGRIQNTIGTFRVYVMLPLISSSLTTASISLQLSARLSPGFVVSQLVPPQLSEVQTPIEEYIEPFALLQSGLTFLRTLAVKQFVVVPVTNTTLATEVCEKLNEPKPVSVPIFATNDQTISGPKVNLKLRQTGLAKKPPSNEWFNWKAPVCDYWNKRVLYDSSVSDKWAVSFGNFTEMHEVAPESDRTRIVAPNNESLVLFTSNSTSWGVPTFDQLREVTSTGLFENLEENESVVYQLNDRTTGSPIMFMRLNPGGFFSTTWAGNSNVYITMADTTINFYSRLPVTTALPPLPASAQLYLEQKKLQTLIDQVRALSGTPMPLSERDSSSVESMSQTSSSDHP